MTFISYAEPLKELLRVIVDNPTVHAKWLNTLSYLENCGARKIAACEHPTLVRKEVLKHAAEEFRHAYYLKQQISRINGQMIENYLLKNLLGGLCSLHYLNILDLKITRYLMRERDASKQQIRDLAYLLVTYAIELRAEELYPIYDSMLRQIRSKVKVKSILLDEKEHLNEMKIELEKHPFAFQYAQQACLWESQLCNQWILALNKDAKSIF
ncbi:MAG: hypothetical protein K0S74_1372 [Chlamydiales bacterium]|jgi:hypothetical protein|nr:hypothetical protein [Chlamydiales bacterium]